MNNKSYVSLEQHACLVCGVAYDTGNLLLDRRLRESMKRYTVTGWGLCAEHARMFSEGYIALVECDPTRSNPSGADRVKPEHAHRTGRLAHVRRHVFTQVFNVTLADDQSCVFVEPGVIERLQAMTEPSE